MNIFKNKILNSLKVTNNKVCSNVFCCKSLFSPNGLYYSTLNHNFQSNLLGIEQDAKKETKRVNIKYLLSIERNMNEATLIKSANHLVQELRVRLSHRIRDMQHLPYIVGCNEHISEVYNLYLTAYNEFQKVKTINNLQEEKNLVLELSKMLKAHNSVVYKLGTALPEMQEYMNPYELTEFLDRMLITRISRRVLVEQHSCFHRLYHGGNQPANFIGIFDTQCSPAKILKKTYKNVAKKSQLVYNDVPDLFIDGFEKATFTYVPIHLEIMLTELLKNAITATVEFNADKESLPPIHATICKGKHHITIRLRDRGGGIPTESLPYIWDYTFSSTKKREDNGRLLSEWDPEVSSLEAGPGFGLPMVRIYSKYFGGNTSVYSLPGYGCDVFVRLGTASSQMESDEITK